MKITVTTSSTSVYDLIVQWLQDNHSYTEADAILMAKHFLTVRLPVIEIENVGSEVIYIDNEVAVATTTGISIGVSSPDNFYSTIAWSIKNVYLVAWATETDVKVKISASPA